MANIPTESSSKTESSTASINSFMLLIQAAELHDRENENDTSTEPSFVHGASVKPPKKQDNEDKNDENDEYDEDENNEYENNEYEYDEDDVKIMKQPKHTNATYVIVADDPVDVIDDHTSRQYKFLIEAKAIADNLKTLGIDVKYAAWLFKRYFPKMGIHKNIWNINRDIIDPYLQDYPDLSNIDTKIYIDNFIKFIKLYAFEFGRKRDPILNKYICPYVQNQTYLRTKLLYAY